MPAEALRPGHYALLAAVALILFLPGFFSLPAIDRDEARFAQASRQMLETRDFIDIRFQDDARHKKPAGIYWLQSASAAALGGADDAPIWAYRIPSLLGAIAAVLLTAWIGASLFTPAIGFLAALMLAGTILMGVEARLAKTDAVLLAAILMAQGAFARIYVAARDGTPAPPLMADLFWVALGLGILVKGPIIVLVAVGTMVVLRLIDREAPWAADLRPLRGIAIALVIVLPWLVAITIVTDGAFFLESVGTDLLGKVAGGQEAHGAPPGYYLLSVWLTFWPFAFLIAAALPWLWARRRETAIRFCIAWIVPTWLVFELVSTKLPHYVLPVFPALALIAAASLDAGADEWPSRWGALARRIGLGLHALVALALAAALIGLWLAAPQIGWGVSMLAAIGALAGGALAFARFPGAERRVAGLLAASLLAVGGAIGGMLPDFQAIWASPRLAEALARASPCPDTRLASAGYTEPSLVFHAGTAIRLGDGAMAARHLIADPACALAAVETAHEPAFKAALAEAGLRPRALGVVRGLNYSRGGQALQITVFRLP